MTPEQLSSQPGTTSAMSPLPSSGHVNREFVARHGPALRPLPQGGTVLCVSRIGAAPAKKNPAKAAGVFFE